MTLAVITDEVFAAEIVASSACMDKLTWTLDEEGTLRVEGTGAMAMLA